MTDFESMKRDFNRDFRKMGKMGMELISLTHLIESATGSKKQELIEKQMNLKKEATDFMAMMAEKYGEDTDKAIKMYYEPDKK